MRDDRCACHGQCGRSAHKPRACAEPDLRGHCRAYHNVAHPRSFRIMHLIGLQIAPNTWIGLCEDCMALYQSGLNREAPSDYPTLFTEGLPI
jgi:hypothetical protein